MWPVVFEYDWIASYEPDPRVQNIVRILKVQREMFFDNDIQNGIFVVDFKGQ